LGGVARAEKFAKALMRGLLADACSPPDYCLFLNNRLGPLPQSLNGSNAGFDHFNGPGMIPCAFGQSFQFLQGLVRFTQPHPVFGALDPDGVRERDLAVDGG